MIVPYKRRKLDREEPVEIYRNLNKHDGGRRWWTIMQNGRVVAHSDGMVAIDCQAIIREAGRKRAIDSGVKNVHAWLRGYIVSTTVRGAKYDNMDVLKYSPETGFVVGNVPVAFARLVALSQRGVMTWGSLAGQVRMPKTKGTPDGTDVVLLDPSGYKPRTLKARNRWPTRTPAQRLGARY